MKINRYKEEEAREKAREDPPGRIPDYRLND
jgi:hypothetical protein